MRKLLLASLLMVCSIPALSVPRYSVEVLNSTYSRGINAMGDIVGAQFSSSVSFQATLTQGNTMTRLGLLPGGEVSDAFGLNDFGKVVGQASLNRYFWEGHAFLYENGKMQDLGTLGGKSSRAVAINNAGVVVGKSNYSGNDWNYHAFMYTEAGGMQDLGTLGGGDSEALAINSKGQILGMSSTLNGSGNASFLYENGTMKDLTPLLGAGREVRGFGSNGEFYGQIYDRSDRRFHGWVWKDGQMREGLDDLDSVTGIDKYGRVIGFSPDNELVVVDGDGWSKMHDLTEAGWTFKANGTVNAEGQIAAYGCKGGSCYSVRLNPIAAVPEPTTYGMLLVGLSLTVFAARRRSHNHRPS